MKYDPFDKNNAVIVDEEQLRELAEEWAEVLNLNHWTIGVRVIRKEDMADHIDQDVVAVEGKSGDISLVGSNNYCLSSGISTITLIHPDDYDCDVPYDMEQTLVHELLHNHFAVIIPYQEAGSLEHCLTERIVNDLASSLVAVKRRGKATGGLADVTPLQGHALTMEDLRCKPYNGKEKPFEGEPITKNIIIRNDCIYKSEMEGAAGSKSYVEQVVDSVKLGVNKSNILGQDNKWPEVREEHSYLFGPSHYLSSDVFSFGGDSFTDYSANLAKPKKQTYTEKEIKDHEELQEKARKLEAENAEELRKKLADLFMNYISEAEEGGK